MKKYKVYFCDICKKEIDQYKGVYQAQSKKFKLLKKDNYDGEMWKIKLHFCPNCYKKLINKIGKELNK